jgi:hypothetical protein
MGEHASCKASSQPSQTSGQAGSQKSSMWEVNLSLQIPAQVVGPQSASQIRKFAALKINFTLADLPQMLQLQICYLRIRDLQTIFCRLKTSMWEVNLSLQIPAKVGGLRISVANPQFCGLEKFVGLAVLSQMLQLRFCDLQIRDLHAFCGLETFADPQVHIFF